MFLQERTHSLIQDEEQEKSVNGPLLTSIMRIMTIIRIIQKYGMMYPNSAVEGLVQNLRVFGGAKKLTDIPY